MEALGRAAPALIKPDIMTVMNVPYHNVSGEEALQRCLALIDEKGRHSVFFLNLECLRIAQTDSEYRDILRSASLVLPDGVGLKAVTKFLGGRVKENCNGSDFSPLLMAECARREYKIYLYGGEDGVARRAGEMIRNGIPGIKIAGADHGYEKSEDVIERINASGADILFAALGAPLQEKWISRNRERLNVRLCLGVGALFDWLSGHRKRCPPAFRALSLEWLWRIGLEPGRMSKRYVINGMPFLARVFLSQLRSSFIKSPKLN